MKLVIRIGNTVRRGRGITKRFTKGLGRAANKIVIQNGKKLGRGTKSIVIQNGRKLASIPKRIGRRFKK